MKLKSIIAAAVLGVLMVGFFAVQHSSAVAGRAIGYGYFTNGDINNYGGWDDVWSGGIQALGNAPSKASFEVFVQNKLNSGSGRDAVGAAYIIETMRGVSGTSFTSSSQGISKAKADYNDWITRINQSSVTMAVEGNTAYTINSAYIPGLNDVAAYSESGSATALVFRVGGAAKYVIKQVCANPLGDLPGLPAPATNHPPTGAFISATCTSGTITVKASFSDPDGATSAYLRNAGGAALTGRATTSPATWSAGVATWPASYWPISLYVADKGGSGDKAVDTQSMPNCAPTGTITLNCTADGSGNGTAEVHFSDPNGSPLGYIAVSGTNAPLTGQHPSGYVWIVPASRAASAFWSLWLDVQDVGGSGFTVVAGASHASCASVTTPTPICTISTFPGVMGVNAPQTFHVEVSLNTAPPSPPTNPALGVTVTGPSGFTTKSFPNEPYTYSSSTDTITSSDMQFTPTTAGDYHVTWSLTGFVTLNCGFGSASGGTPNTGSAGYQPYLTVQGGDASAGAAACGQTADAPAGIRSWNNDNVGGTGYYGATVQLAALATGNIANMPTGSGNASIGNGNTLSFANTTASGTNYGGSYGAGIACVPDYAGAALGDTTTAGVGTDVNLADPSFQDGKTYKYSSNITIHGTLPAGKYITIVVADGYNAVVNANIDYAAYGLATVPRLNLYVQGGDILIGSAVDHVHGFFVAEQDDAGTGGTFYSCANAPTSSPIDLTAATDYATCNHQLTVFGAVSAQQLVLHRTYGSLTADAAKGVPASPGEVFQYSPELWLAEPSGTGGSNQSALPYSSITSLPPVL